MKRFLISILGTVVVLVAIVGLAITLGGPGKPSAMPSINDPFNSVDFSDLPKFSYFMSRDGAKLAFRDYPAWATQSKGAWCSCTALLPVAAACT